MKGSAEVVHLDGTSRDEAVKAQARRKVVVIGNFDGVHRGHKAVLVEAVAVAEARGLEPVVLTFDPHPAAVLGRSAPALLTTLARRAELMGELGVPRVFVRAFDRAFAAESPEDFARTLLAGALRAEVVVVGDNFRFGKGRSGDLDTLRRLGESLGFEAHAHAMTRDAGGAYSSTRARDAVRAGDLDAVRAVLGRCHALEGVVVHGDKRGRTIGFPTANLDEVRELLPPEGVYAVRVSVLGEDGVASKRLADGVMNLGRRPTVDANATTPRIEVHAFLPESTPAENGVDLYGARLRVELVAKLRDEKKFAGLDALKAQIADDVAAAKARLAGEPAR